MIPSTIEYINSQIDTLGFFSYLRELTGVFRKGDRAYPAIYVGGGDSDEINFDFSRSTCYHRLTGEVAITQAEDETVGCEEMTTETYPMRLVCYFPKDILNKDDQYVEMRVCNNIKKVLANSNVTSVANDFGLYTVQINVDSADLDSFSVWGDEFSGIDFRMQSDYCLIAIDYNIVLTGNTTCFYEYVCE